MKWVPVLQLVFIFLFQMAMAGNGDSLRTFFIQGEFMAGKNVRIYDKFPASSMRKTFTLDLGYIYQDTTSQWVSYYHYPILGLSLVYSDLGNPLVLSKEYSLIPYIQLRTSLNPKKSLDFKLGLGLSYDTRPYDPERNPDNLVIGSRFNWGLQALIYKNLVISDRMYLKAGIGFIHTSDAHTKLPNYGLNSTVVSVALQFPQGNSDPFFPMNHKKLPVNKSGHFFLQARFGYGWHQLGGTTDPIGGPTYPVDNYTISTGLLIHQQLKISAGLTYRFYHSFYHYILNTPDIQWGTDPAFYRKNPRSNSSDVIFFLGSEFLLGHFGFEINEGLHLYKPFYREFNYRWEFKHGFDYLRNRYIASRIGLNYYLVDTSKLPHNNVWFGAHIDANFGKADFMELCVGYSHLW